MKFKRAENMFDTKVFETKTHYATFDGEVYRIYKKRMNGSIRVATVNSMEEVIRKIGW